MSYTPKPLPQEYKWIKKLGKGSFGEVFEVEYQGKKYAAKKIQKIRLISPKTKQSFEREIDILNKMSQCENSVKFIGYFEENNFEIIILELCDCDLIEVLNNSKNGMDSSQIYCIMDGLNNAFKYMNNNKIIHRDIKLENILVKYNDYSHTSFIPKINDYGLSREIQGGIASTWCGSPLYMAPEVLLNKKYDDKADLWSIGILIYILHFKEIPFDFNININDINDEDVESSLHTSKKRNSKDELLDDLLNKLLKYEPNQRLSWDNYFNHPFFTKNKKYNINIDSKIIDNNEEYKNILIQWLEKPNSNINNNVKNISNISLLYRGSRDGFKSSDFHDKCNNKGETLTIIQSDEGYIFGGYTEIDWDNTTWNGRIGEKNNARRNGKGNEFVFTLKNPHNISPSKYNMQKSWLNHSICCDVNLGPIFGCNDIRIENNCNIRNNSFTFYDFNPGEYCFDDTTGKKRLLFTGKNRFIVKEIEVFQIIR